jgi:hypothetical protein
MGRTHWRLHPVSTRDQLRWLLITRQRSKRTASFLSRLVEEQVQQEQQELVQQQVVQEILAPLE